ncbi:MAG: AI-2E family transporter [archaeon]
MGERRIVDYSIVFIAVVLFVLVLSTLQSFLRPFFLALVLSFLLMPIIRWLKKWRIPLWLTLALLVILVLSSVFLLGSLLQDDTSALIAAVSRRATQIDETIASLNEAASLLAGDGVDISIYLDPDKVSGIIIGSVSTLVSGLGVLLSELLLVLLFLMFIIPSYDLTVTGAKRDMKEINADRLQSMISKVERSVRAYLATKTLISLATAVASGILLTLFGAKFIILFMMLTFLLNYIPNIGSFVAVAITVAVYMMTAGIGWPAAILLVLLAAVQFIFGSILEPKMAGKRLRLSPMVILLGLLFWGWVWGVIGMLLAVPLTSIVKIILEHFESTKTIAKIIS